MSEVTEKKKGICKKLNDAAWNWQDGEGLKKAVEDVCLLGHDVKARGDEVPVCTSGNYVCPWVGKDVIMRNAGEWRFFNFQIRKKRYTQGELNYDNRREYVDWMKQQWYC